MDLNAVESVLFLADSYKITHHRQYPPGTEYVYSYFESRGGKWEDVCFFGLQYIIKRWLVGPVVNKKSILEAKNFYLVHFGGQDVFNEEGWNYIVDKHNGYLPLKIRAVLEGTVVPYKNALFTVENTDPEVPWLTNWFETLLVQAWYPSTVCTNSRYQKEIIAKYMMKTADSLDGLPFKLHDFGYRGASSVESAAIGGAAHMVNFVGTDTIAGLQMLRKYYHCPMAGFSIPAAEHSTMTTWGRDGEMDACRHMLEQFPVGLVSVVSDSYDIYNCVENIWGKHLKDLIVTRGTKGCLVIRPDSGEPEEVVVNILNLLEKTFEVKINSKGYKQLPPYLRVIQGDGISFETIGGILEAMEKSQWSADNVVFGTGGALLQRVDRDTQKCAFKCSYVEVKGEGRNVFKQPITDAVKKSKRGKLTLELRHDGTYATVEEGKGNPALDQMVTVYENGRIIRDQTLSEIRERAEIDIVKESVAENGAT